MTNEKTYEELEAENEELQDEIKQKDGEISDLKDEIKELKDAEPDDLDLDDLINEIDKITDINLSAIKEATLVNKIKIELFFSKLDDIKLEDLETLIKTI